MKTLYVRPLTKEEREALQKGLKSTLSFRMRRSQILLWSADERLKIGEIAKRLQLSHEAVRQVIHAFHEAGVSCIQPKSRARHDEQRAFNEVGRSALREALNHSPREFGYERSFWTLELLAVYSYQKGWTKQKVHLDTVSQTLHELGVKWRRSKTWISSPDEAYEIKKAP
jgi:transposase